MKKLLILLSATLLVVGCGKKDEKKENVENKVKKHVVVAEVKKELVSDKYITDGTIVPQEKINHHLNSDGTVDKIFKENGDYVKKGDVIVSFTDEKTKSAFDSAKSSFNVAATTYRKFRTLYNQSMISEIEFLNYKNSYESALANYENAKSNYNKLTRKSELSGYLGNLYLKSGNTVKAEDILFTVVNEEVMEITVDFPGYWLNLLSEGLEVEIFVPDLNNKKFIGKIKTINPIANDHTKKFPIEITINNLDKELKDGMYSKVIIPTEKRDSLIVPETAIFIRNLSSYIYKVENGKVVKVEVKTGATASPNIEVTAENLKAGDNVVSDGVFGLSDNEEVIINN